MLETNVIETRFSVLEQKIVALTASNEELLASNAELLSQRDQYKKLYLSTLELCRKLEQGILGQKRERFSSNEEQLTLALLGTFLEKQPLSEEFTKEKVSAHTRKKPTGRMDIPDHLPHVDVEVLPPEVRQKGLDAFERIGEEITKTLERRPASLVVVCTHKPKFVLKGRDRTAETKVFQATPPELPIERGLAGPGLLADTIVRRWQDHLPTPRRTF